jgi:PAS domain S-box-containing protein
MYRRLVESSRDGFWAFDRHGRTLFANRRAAELLGRTVAEMEGLCYSDVLDEQGKAQFAAHLEDINLRGPNRLDVEVCYLREDGSRALLMCGESVLRDQDGETLGYVHRLTDDALRRELIHDMSRSREQLDEAQKIARVSSWEVDLMTGEVAWSRQMYDMLGLDPDVVPTIEAFFRRVVREDRDRVAEEFRRAHEETGEFRFDARAHRTDSTTGWFRGLGRVAYAPDGTPLRMGGTVQDITDIKEVELQLVDAVVLNGLMQVMATAANQAETLAEALELTRGQLLAHDDWSRAVGFRVTVDASGRRGLEPFVLGQNRPDIVPNDLELRVARRALETRGTVFEETESPDQPLLGFLLSVGDDPLLVVVMTATSPFARHAMLQSMVEQVADQLARVAEREQAAVELAAARDAAMEASRLKSDFLATMSHEIRTPMNGVIGLNELLLRSELDSHQRRLAQGTQVAGHALLGLINDILDFSKIEAGQLELEKVRFEVRPVFDQVAEILAGAARDKGIDLTVLVDPCVPLELVGDPNRLGQILSNLMTNAVKFTSKGQVTVRASVAAGDVSTVTLRVEVVDTGIGVGDDQADRLFEPFSQADASTTRTFGGTGLGLAISRQLVSAIGGDIGVASKLGEGSTFWFTGRFAHAGTTTDKGSRVAMTQTDGGAAHRTGHLLVVEDNEINQLVALGLLEALGYSAEVAVNGAEAVQKASNGAYDAVLMDLQMPVMDGFAATRHIRSEEPAGTRIPIIAMTASAIEGEKERCLAAGMDDFLTKPVVTDRLEAVLRGYLGGPTPLRGPAEPPPAPSTTVALDPSRIRELESMGGRAVELVDRAVRNFVTSLPATLAELHGAVATGAHEELRALAHRLRGSALNLGALRVAEVGFELEHLDDADMADRALTVIAELRQAAEEAAVALLDHRSGRVLG